MPSQRLKRYLADKQRLQDRIGNILAGSRGGGGLTDQDQQEVDDLRERLIGLNSRISREKEFLTREQAALDAANLPEDCPPGLAFDTIGGVTEGFERDPRRGFRDSREFLTALVTAGPRPAQAEDLRIRYLAAAGSDEHAGMHDAYGGVLIPEALSPMMLRIGGGADPFAGRTTPVDMPSGVLKIPARTDKDHSNSVSGGLRVYRKGETQQPSSSRMEMEDVKLEATTLMGLTYASEELLSRSTPAFITILEAGFRDEFRSKHVRELLNGTGVGEPEGVNNAAAKIDVDAEAGQSAATIVGENLLNMRARCWGYENAIWLANQKCLPQLAKACIESPNNAGVILMYRFSMQEDVPDTLLGRPVFYTEHCATLGTVGDLLLVTPSEIIEGTVKPLQSAESIHVRFLEHERTFKFWLENDARPWWRSVLTPDNGDTLAPIVRLATRD